MQNEILAIYTAETISSFIVFLVCANTLVNKYLKRKKYNNIFWLTVAITTVFFALTIRRAWWMVWKEGYLSRDAVAWMMDSPLVFLQSILIICGSMIFIKVMTEDSHDGRLWKICTGIVVATFIIAWIKR